VLGQTAEIIWVEKEKTNLSDKDWFFIGDGKTSYYTIAGPMRLGAIIAGATNTQLNPLAEFGLYLGRCFQLVDDILDLTSDFIGLKKQTGNDIYEGKRTLMLGHLLRKANSKDKKKIISILKKSRDQKTEKEVKWMIIKMYQYKSIEYARQIAKEHKEKAHKIFKNELRFLSKQPARKHLEQIIDFILEREY
jgi:geranylgeranyl diphosphate synthase type II